MYYLPYDYSCNIDQTDAFAGGIKQFHVVASLLEYLVAKLKLKSICEPHKYFGNTWYASQNVYITKNAFPESKSKNYLNVTMIIKFGTH